MERKAAQPRFARRSVWSSAKTAVVLLGIGFVGSAVTLLVHRLDPSDTILADAVIMPSATAQVSGRPLPAPANVGSGSFTPIRTETPARGSAAYR